MRPRLSISRSAVELIKAFEGYRAKAEKLDDGRWTIGYGHTLTAREGAEVSEPDAEALLLYDLIAVAHAVNEHCFAPLTQNQFDALASFVFNIGVRSFRGSPTLRRLNEGRALEAALAMEMWRKSDLEGERIVIDALVRRRAAEKALFLRPPEGWVPAPSPVLPPKIDYDVASVLPLHTPIATHAPLGGDRAFAERAPDPTFEPPEAPSASTVAAAAVIERLEAILADTETETPAKPAPAATVALQAPPAATIQKPVEKPAEKPAETPREPPLFIPPSTLQALRGRQQRRRIHPLVYLALAAVGVGLFMLAGLWAFEPQPAQVLGAPSVTAGLVAGILGIGCVATAIYFLLERLGLPRDKN